MRKRMAEAAAREFSIPKSVFRRIVKTMVPDDKHVSKDAMVLLQGHCEDLARSVFERTNVIAGKNGRITIKKDDFDAVVNEIDFVDTPIHND
jgi:histone H3/H4